MNDDELLTQIIEKNKPSVIEKNESSETLSKATISEVEPSAIDKGIQQIREQEQEYLKEIESFYRKQKSEQIPSTNDPTKGPLAFLNHPLEFYTTLLSVSKEHSGRLNQCINAFLSSKTPGREERMTLTSSYWDFCDHLLKEVLTAFSVDTRVMFRYGIVVSSAVAPSVLTEIQRIDLSFVPQISVYYLDEWVERVSAGKISQTVLNDINVNIENQIAVQRSKIESLRSQTNVQFEKAEQIDLELKEGTQMLQQSVEILSNRDETEHDFDAPFNEEQLNQIKAIKDSLGSLQSKNAMLETVLQNIYNVTSSINKNQQDYEMLLENKTEFMKNNPSSLDSDDVEFDTNENEVGDRKNFISKMVQDEFSAIRQMIKMCVGKKGNHVPVLYSHYFSGPIDSLGTRDRVIKLIQEIEEKDFTVFHKKIRGHVERAFPNVLLVPCYGNFGICWEPYERLSKNTTSGKLIIPMYAHDLRKKILYALGDFRWQFAKENAGPLWMEEGLSGWYFQWFESNIKKGDIKEAFIKDYVLWIESESIGLQKLTREVREMFWRFIPLQYEIRESLTRRSPVYGDLMQKEKNREFSQLI